MEANPVKQFDPMPECTKPNDIAGSYKMGLASYMLSIKVAMCVC